MTKQEVAKMFLADERGVNKTEWFESRNTFNFGAYQHEHKQPVGDIHVLNDDILEGGRSYSMQVENEYTVYILPVSGAVKFSIRSGNETLAVAGQVGVLSLKRGDIFTVSNPFSDQWVNLLQVWIKKNEQKESTAALITFPNINDSLNQLTALSEGADLYIGKFKGRGETIFKTPDYDRQNFVFVVEGAFEVSGRLLHPRDGLVLYAQKETDIEALSNGAILILISLPLNSHLPC